MTAVTFAFFLLITAGAALMVYRYISSRNNAILFDKRASERRVSDRRIEDRRHPSIRAAAELFDRRLSDGALDRRVGERRESDRRVYPPGYIL